MRRLPVKTALVGLLVAPGAMAQQTPDLAQAAPPPDPNQTKPADPSAAPATMAPVTVTGTRPSEDFAKPASALDRVGDLRDTPQSVTVITNALMKSQGSTSLTSAISRVPGVTVGAAEGGQIGTNINLNGFSARTVWQCRRPNDGPHGTNLATGPRSVAIKKSTDNQWGNQNDDDDLKCKHGSTVSRRTPGMPSRRARRGQLSCMRF